LIEEYLGLVDEAVDELGSRREIEGVRWILEHGTGADRQLAAFERAGGDLRQVVQFMAEETKAGL
jgi:glutamate---cysteine ligase / carboxylate-amine ligase